MSRIHSSCSRVLIGAITCHARSVGTRSPTLHSSAALQLSRPPGILESTRQCIWINNHIVENFQSTISPGCCYWGVTGAVYSVCHNRLPSSAQCIAQNVHNEGERIFWTFYCGSSHIYCWSALIDHFIQTMSDDDRTDCRHQFQWHSISVLLMILG